jgi:hypothetical protein
MTCKYSKSLKRITRWVERIRRCEVRGRAGENRIRRIHQLPATIDAKRRFLFLSPVAL